MKLRRLTAMCMAAAMLTTTGLAGCGKSGDDPVSKNDDGKVTADDGKEEEGKEGERPKITVATPYLKAENVTEDNYALRWLEEQTGVDIEFIFLPESDWETKVNLMLASDEKPDVICAQMDRNKVIVNGKDGLFIPLNDLYEKHSVYLKQIFEEHPEYEKKAYDFDGNMYGFLHINECVHCQVRQKLWYNREWLDSLNLKEPETIEEFEAVMRAVKESDYNGNGKEDEIPMTGSGDWNNHLEAVLLNSFIPFNRDNYAYSKDGKVLLSVDTDEFREGLRWIHHLYDEGLIDPGAFSQNEEQQKQLVRSNPDRVFSYVGFIDQGVDFLDHEQCEAFWYMMPVEGPNGARYMDYCDMSDMNGGSFNWFITDGCKNPEAAFKVGDVLCSEAAHAVLFYGEEGVHWQKRDPEEDSLIDGFKAKYQALKIEDPTDQEKNTLHIQMEVVLDRIYAQWLTEPEDWFVAYGELLTKSSQDMLKYAPKEYVPRRTIILDTEDAEEFAELKTLLSSYIDTAIVQFIVGEKDIEKDWDTYVEELHGYNTDRFLELLQKAKEYGEV